MQPGGNLREVRGHWLDAFERREQLWWWGINLSGAWHENNDWRRKIEAREQLCPLTFNCSTEARIHINGSVSILNESLSLYIFTVEAVWGFIVKKKKKKGIRRERNNSYRQKRSGAVSDVKEHSCSLHKDSAEHFKGFLLPGWELTSVSCL